MRWSITLHIVIVISVWILNWNFFGLKSSFRLTNIDCVHCCHCRLLFIMNDLLFILSIYRWEEYWCLTNLSSWECKGFHCGFLKSFFNFLFISNQFLLHSVIDISIFWSISKLFSNVYWCESRNRFMWISSFILIFFIIFLSLKGFPLILLLFIE